MKPTLQFIIRHLAAFIFFILYTWICISVISIFRQFHEALKHRKPGESGIMLGGEGVGLSEFFLGIIAIVYILTLFINGVARKTDKSFYFWLCFIALVETMVTFNIH